MSVSPLEPRRDKAVRRSMGNHPGGKKIKAENRCWNCNHTIPAHTDGAHEGEGGCAYCRCKERPDKPAESG